jgi:hypothetical protein
VARGSLLRTQLVEALGAAKAREASDQLVPLLNDPSLWVRQAAAVTFAPQNQGARRRLASLQAH